MATDFKLWTKANLFAQRISNYSIQHPMPLDRDRLDSIRVDGMVAAFS